MNKSENQDGLVAFQEKLLGKIDERANIENQVANQWLEFVVDKNTYFVPLSRVKEVIQPPARYLDLSGWVHDGVLGGIQHRDEVWTVFSGVKAAEERAHKFGDPWEYRLLLLRQEEVDAYIAIAADRVLGLVPAQKISGSVDENGLLSGMVDAKKITLLEPVIWSGTKLMTNISV